MAEPEVTLLMHLLHPPVWPTKTQPGDLPRDELPDRDKILAGIWVSWLLILIYNSNIANYYLPSIYSRLDVLLDTILTIFITHSTNICHILSMCQAYLKRNIVANKMKSNFCFLSLHSSVCTWAWSSVISELCPGEKIPLRMFSGV